MAEEKKTLRQGLEECKKQHGNPPNYFAEHYTVTQFIALKRLFIELVEEHIGLKNEVAELRKEIGGLNAKENKDPPDGHSSGQGGGKGSYQGNRK